MSKTICKELYSMHYVFLCKTEKKKKKNTAAMCFRGVIVMIMI